MSDKTVGDLMQDDVGALLTAVGLPCVSMPKSCHAVIQEDILPEIKKLKSQLAERDNKIKELEAKIQLYGQSRHPLLQNPNEIDQMKEKIKIAVEALEECAQADEHEIPYYAYGDNEAGVDMSHRLSLIGKQAKEALQKLKQ